MLVFDEHCNIFFIFSQVVVRQNSNKLISKVSLVYPLITKDFHCAGENDFFARPPSSLLKQSLNGLCIKTHICWSVTMNNIFLSLMKI